MTIQLPVTQETFGMVQSVDPSGRAWALYSFYARAAVKQDSSQPLCTDHFCKKGLKWGSIHTVRKARKNLEKAGVISLERKYMYSYVTVNYLTATLKNNRFNLSETEVKREKGGLELLETHWPLWWERLSGSCFDIFMKRLKKQLAADEMPDYDLSYNYLNAVYDRMTEVTLGLWSTGPRHELDFWNYLLKAVASEFKKDAAHV
jgi:hypothetical protein